jgi:glycosyltransferase involved in cell wall biosynthesis
MKILYITDGRSPIAINWISYFIHQGHEIHLISTFPCQQINGLTSFLVIPMALSGFYTQPELKSGYLGRLLRRIIPVELRTQLRQLITPVSFNQAAESLSKEIERIQPDLVHAMRIPYEGIIASLAMEKIRQSSEDTKKPRLLLSVWGNDFTLHARSTQTIEMHTRQALKNCDALHTDCQRDLNLAREFDFISIKPSIVLPGGGGVKLEVFYPAERSHDVEDRHFGKGYSPISIINPRGFRAYVRNDTFFHAIPLILEKYPRTHFICIGMAGEPQALEWITDLGIGAQVSLIPQQSQLEMAEWFRRSLISVSITTHDGTPNTLLEAMACGCFPIAGDIESLREWITPGMNGLLVDPSDAKALASGILEVIENPELCEQAREMNIQLVKERAEYDNVMQIAEEFYQRIIEEI